MRTITFATVLALAALSAPAGAHHGWSSYDETKTIDTTLTLNGVQWANPHGSAKASYKGAAWDVVLAPVSRMEARGLTPEMIGPGKKVRLVGYPRRDGTKEMRIERVIADGKTVELR